MLRAAQFPEDQGPLAHPVRPDSYIEIGNFYTATVYNKGAELIRMFAHGAGPEKFRKGTDLYFDRHDGEAATCDDFVTALEDGSGVDLTPFKIWYSQAGTPKVLARLEHDPRRQTATLHLEQHDDPTPGQPTKQPMPIPLKTALIGEQSGAEICAGAADPARPAEAEHHVRECRRDAFAVDQPRFLGAGRARPRARQPTSSSGWRRPIPTRSRATRRCRN